MISPDLKTATALTGIILGGGIFINGCYFIDTIGKPLIFTGVLLTLFSVAYIVLYTKKVENAITPEPETISSV